MPRTAYLTSEVHLERQWRQVKSATRSSKIFAQCKWQGHNYFGTTLVCEISGGFIKFHPNVVFRRARIHMLSGIQRLWGKWVKLQQEFWGKRNEANVIASSSNNCDVGHIFWLYVCCLGAAVMALVAEIIGNQITTKTVRKTMSECSSFCKVLLGSQSKTKGQVLD